MSKNKVLEEGALAAPTRKIINDNLTDVSRCTTQFDAVTGTTGTTLTNVVGMVTDSLEPGRYKFKVTLSCTATANTGIKAAFKWGTASMITSALYVATLKTASAVIVTKSTTATDQTAIFDNTADVVIAATIEGIIVVALAGTVQLQAAQHTAHADTTSVLANSFMEFEKISAT